MTALDPVMVTFNSKPQGAVVTVDGHPRGSTPIQIFLAPGAHTVSFDVDGKVIAREVAVAGVGQNSWTYFVGQGRIE